jgi:hypothetical protein
MFAGCPTMQTLTYRGHWLHLATRGNATSVLVMRPDYTFLQHVFPSVDSAKRAVRKFAN